MIKHWKKGFQAIALAVLLIHFVSAAEPVNLFAEQRVVLEGATEAQQRSAIADALEAVLKRASGLDRLPRHSAFVQAQRDPMPLLRASELAPSDILLPNAIGHLEPTFRLQLMFDPSSIIELLANMGLPYWGSPRPQTLMVIAAPQGDVIDVVTDWSAAPAVADIIRLGSAQGLPLIWPELDLDELLLLHPDDLWLGVQQPLQTMAEKYSAALVLGGHLEYLSDEEVWVGRWQLVDAHNQVFRTVSAETMQAVIEPAMRWVSEHFSAQYAISPSGEMSEFVFPVHQINSLATQTQVSRYLLQLPGTEGVVMQQINGSSVVYRVRTRATEQQWLAWLALQERLVPVGSDALDFDDMAFHWHG